MENVLKTTSVAEFCSDNQIEAISKVRENANGFKYCTFISAEKDEEGKSLSENIYLSKGLAAEVAVGQAPSEFISGRVIAYTTNAEGEPRIKLSRGGNGEYDQVSDLF